MITLNNGPAQVTGTYVIDYPTPDVVMLEAFVSGEHVLLTAHRADGDEEYLPPMRWPGGGEAMLETCARVAAAHLATGR